MSLLLALTGGGTATGDLAAVEAGLDGLVAAAQNLPQGSLTVSEAGSDAFVSDGDTIVQGSLAVSELGSDTLASDGASAVIGALSVAETGADTFVSGGGAVATGALTVSESGSDTFAADGVVRTATVNVKVSWFQFDTAIKVVETSTGGSAPKLRFTPFFEAHVGVPSNGLRSGSTPVDAEGKEATLVSVQSLGCFSGCAVLDVQSAASFEIIGVGAASGGALPEVCASVTALVSGVGSSAGMTSFVASGDADVCVGSYFAGSRAAAVDVLAIQNPTDEELIFLMRKMRRVDNSLTC